jgi:hypothetical protein
VVRRQRYLSGGDLVMDIRQHVEHLAALRHGGVLAQTESNLSGEDLEVRSQEAQQRVRRKVLIVRQCSLLEEVKTKRNLRIYDNFFCNDESIRQ